MGRPAVVLATAVAALLEVVVVVIDMALLGKDTILANSVADTADEVAGADDGVLMPSVKEGTPSRAAAVRSAACRAGVGRDAAVGVSTSMAEVVTEGGSSRDGVFCPSVTPLNRRDGVSTREEDAAV